MKKRIMRTLIAAACTAALCISLAAPAFAAQKTPMEIASDRAVEAAIKAGTVPAGTTIYDCMYGSKDGVTVVIQYKDKDGNWIDVATGKKVAAQTQETTESQSQPVASTEKFSDKALVEYADRVFELVNQEREKAGVALLERNDTLNAGATTRALECASLNSLYVDGKAHTRPDGSRWFTVFGIEKNYNYGENSGQGGTADERMVSFMKSEGHRANILREDYTEIGIGCAVSEQGEIFTVQIFYRP